MRALTSSDFLDLWERGASLHPLDQGLLILGAGLPEVSYDGLADWPLGRRNAALARLRCACFGPRLEAWMACPECGEKLELNLDGRSLAQAPAGAQFSEPIVARGRRFRLPSSRDLARVARETDPRSAAFGLLESCRLEPGESTSWSEDDLDEVGQGMAQADPMAEILLTLQCPECGAECNTTLDIAAFLWEEIEARAKRLLRDIHTLAFAYGWAEKEILSLSEHRRAFYLEMVQQ
jgi:hypothetical protein